MSVCLCLWLCVCVCVCVFNLCSPPPPLPCESHTPAFKWYLKKSVLTGSFLGGRRNILSPSIFGRKSRSDWITPLRLLFAHNAWFMLRSKTGKKQTKKKQPKWVPEDYPFYFELFRLHCLSPGTDAIQFLDLRTFIFSKCFRVKSLCRHAEKLPVISSRAFWGVA